MMTNRVEKEITLIYEDLVMRYKAYNSYSGIKILDCRNMKGNDVTLYRQTESLICMMYYCDIKKAVENNKAVALYRRNKIYVVDQRSLMDVTDHFTLNRYLGYYDLFNTNSIMAFMHFMQAIKNIENSKLTVIDKNSMDDEQLWNLINMMY